VRGRAQTRVTLNEFQGCILCGSLEEVTLPCTRRPVDARIAPQRNGIAGEDRTRPSNPRSTMIYIRGNGGCPKFHARLRSCGRTPDSSGPPRKLSGFAKTPIARGSQQGGNGIRPSDLLEAKCESSNHCLSVSGGPAPTTTCPITVMNSQSFSRFLPAEFNDSWDSD